MVPKFDSGNSQASTAKDIPDGLEVVPTTQSDKQVVQAEKEVSHLEEDFPIPMERAHGDADYMTSKENQEVNHGPKYSPPRHRTGREARIWPLCTWGPTSPCTARSTAMTLPSGWRTTLLGRRR